MFTFFHKKTIPIKWHWTGFSSIATMLAINSVTVQKIEMGENFQRSPNTVQREESFPKRKKNENRCSVILHYVSLCMVLAKEQTFSLLWIICHLASLYFHALFCILFTTHCVTQSTFCKNNVNIYSYQGSNMRNHV